MKELAPRASGKRRSFAEISPVVLEWLHSQFGELEIVREYKGGMSPGCATSIVTTAGRQLFIKAVDDDPDDVTADLFRHEAHVLSTLPTAGHRPSLLGCFDDGAWVALVMEHVKGDYPDFSDGTDLQRVADALKAQADELSPPPVALEIPSLGECIQWWVSRWEDITADPGRYLPVWAVPLADGGLERAQRLIGQLPSETVCHFDVRNDNLLLGPDGDVIFIDWGIAMTGPKWSDLLMLALQDPDPIAVDRHLRAWISPDLEELLTDFLVAFGGSQAWDSQLPVPRRLPTLRAYLADDAERLLRAAAVRLGQPVV